MKKIKTILKIVGIIIAIIIIAVLILKISITQIYDGKEIELISKEEITVYLTDIKYDNEQGPQLYFRFDTKGNESDTYNMEVTTRYINGVNLFGYGDVNAKDTATINLYRFYKNDLEALKLKTNNEKLKKYGYTEQDYKTAFSNINSFDLEIELYKWVHDEEEQSNENEMWTIDIARGHEEKIGSAYKIIKVKGNENNLLKKLYKTIKIEQRKDITNSISEKEWKNFDEIIPSEIIENIDTITGMDMLKKTDVVLQQLRNKKYAEYTEEKEIPENYANKNQEMQMFDQDGKQIMTITPYYISNKTAVPDEYYKITYQEKTMYYYIKD